MKKYLFVVVKCGRFYADGFWRWVSTQRRAMKFTDANSGPNGDAIAWANGHAEHLRTHSLYAKPRRRIRVVRVVECAKRAA